MIPGLKEAKDLFRRDIIVEAKNQGHYRSGKTANSIEVDIAIVGNDIRLTVYGEVHAAYLNDGVPANKIPFSPGSGKKSSEYIEGLIRHFKSLGLMQDEAEDAAWALAMYRHREKKGMPTPGSFKFSRTGKRTGFITETFNDRQHAYAAVMIGQAQEGVYAELNELSTL